jgi:hypothetical protein
LLDRERQTAELESRPAAGPPDIGNPPSPVNTVTGIGAYETARATPALIETDERASRPVQQPLQVEACEGVLGAPADFRGEGGERARVARLELGAASPRCRG